MALDREPQVSFLNLTGLELWFGFGKESATAEIKEYGPRKVLSRFQTDRCRNEKDIRFTQEVKVISLPHTHSGTGEQYLTVLAYGLYRAGFHRAHALFDLFRRRGLLKNVGVTVRVITGEEVRRFGAAGITVDTLVIDVKFTLCVIRPFFIFFSHNAFPLPFRYFTQS